MVTWSEFEAAEPDMAARVKAKFDAGRHKTMATLRADGSPRISGTECDIKDGQVSFGSMPNARKLADILRDPRLAIHGPTFHPAEGAESEWPGEAKIAGRAVHAGPVTPEGEEGLEGEMFTVDIGEVAITGLNDEGTMLVVEWWTPQGGRQRIERA